MGWMTIIAVLTSQGGRAGTLAAGAQTRLEGEDYDATARYSYRHDNR